PRSTIPADRSVAGSCRHSASPFRRLSPPRRTRLDRTVACRAWHSPRRARSLRYRMVDRRPPALFISAIGKERSMQRLAGKVVFITGAGSGIGRATAILFAGEGAKVAIAEIDARAGEETAHLAGNEAIAIRADVTDPESLQPAIRATADNFGRLAGLHK